MSSSSKNLDLMTPHRDFLNCITQGLTKSYESCVLLNNLRVRHKSLMALNIMLQLFRFEEGRLKDWLRNKHFEY